MERAIRTIKGLMKQCTMAKQSWRLALIEYLATPLDSNTTSPSELNGHKFNSLLPNVSTLSSNKHSDVLVSCHEAQLQQDRRGHVLPELPIGSTVCYCDHATNNFNVGVVSDRDARLYTILTENGTHISRNRIDLKCTSVQFDPKPDSNILPKTRHTVSSDANSKHALLLSILVRQNSLRKR